MSDNFHLLGCDDAKAFICDSPWGFAEIDAEGKFAWLNRAYCQILNAPLELLVGKDIADWVHSEDRAIFKLKLEQVTRGEETAFVLSKRYIQRGSTPQRQLVIWGILSVQGKWDSKTGSYSGSRVTFREYDPVPSAPKWGIPQVRQLSWKALQWGLVNWRTVLTVVAVAASLMGASSGKLFETLRQAKDTKDYVDSQLESLSRGAPLLPSSQSSPTSP